MGIFADYATKYWESGLQPVPIELDSKILRVKKSNEKFFNHFLSEESLEKYIKTHGGWGIGVALGKVSNIVAIDFDYCDQPDSKAMESMVLGILPPSPVSKKGKKGWTKFYRYNSNIRIRHFRRNDQAFVDVLSTGSYTVLPPTGHEDGVTYKWLTEDTLLDIDIRDLPSIDYKSIKEIENLCEFNLNDCKAIELNRSTRHDMIFSFVMKNSDTADDIEDLIQKTIEFDRVVNASNPKGPYFKDQRYLMNKSVHKACNDLIVRMLDWKTRKLNDRGIDWSIGRGSTTFFKTGANGKLIKSTDYNDFREFFELRLPDTRKDLFSDACFTKIKGEWRATENIIKVIESEASQVGLSHTFCERHLLKWFHDKDPELLIDIKTWDQKDHIGFMARHISSPEFEAGEIDELLKQWLCNVFRRIFEPWQQNTFLIFKGAQNLGKDTWIKRLLAGFSLYFDEVPIVANKVENFKTVGPLAIGFVPEFEESNKSTLASLKSLITVESSRFRDSYGRKADRHTFRHSFISSANFDDLLRDPSGNRRFWIIELDDIDWSYLKEVDPDGVVAQAYHLYRSGFKAKNEVLDHMREVIKDETPISSDVLFLEEYISIVGAKEENIRDAMYGDGDVHVGSDMLNDPKIRWPMIANELERCGRKYGFSPRRMQSIIRKAGLSRPDRKTTYYSSVKIIEID